MNTKEILQKHNRWRRGDDTRTMDELGFSVTELGLAIDDAVRAISERDQLRAEMESMKNDIMMEKMTNNGLVKSGEKLIEECDQLRAELAKERERVRVAGSEAIRKMCEAWLSEAGDLPNQHENKSRGCSTYNWQTHYARAGLAHADRISVLSAGEGGE